MASDDQNSVPQTSVTRETIKGAAKGAAAPFVAAGVTVAGTAALATGVIAPPVVAYKLSGAVNKAAGGGAKGALAVAAVWVVGAVVSAAAVVGGMLGFGKGVAKSSGERLAAREQSQSGENIQATVQQAYLAGARDGQMHLVQEMQKAQEAQLAKQAGTQAVNGNGQAGSFAAKVEQKKDSISPEAIAKQREVASAASAQIG